MAPEHSNYNTLSYLDTLYYQTKPSLPFEATTFEGLARVRHEST